MANSLALGAALAMLAGCGVTELYPPVVTGGGVGGIGGNTGSNGGRTTGSTVAGVNTGTVAGDTGTTTNGPPGSSSSRGVGTLVGNTGTSTGTGVGSGVGTIGFTNGSTGRVTSNNNGTTSAGNGTASGTGTGGGCTALYTACDPQVGCGCGNSCVFDAVLDGDVCEQTCKNKGCSDPKTTCDGTNCVLIPCGDGSGNGTYDGTCSADGKSGDMDGTCVPIPLDGGSAFCELAGTSDGGCDPDATRSQPQSLCIIGEYCAPKGVNNVCYTLCQPGFGSGGSKHCQDEGFSFCIPLDTSLTLGVCF